MYLNHFSVRVTPGRETEDGYHELVHGQEYKLHLKNKRSQPCDAVVHVDGKHIGTLRINSHDKIVLERPESDAKLLTFYLRDSDEAKAALLDCVDRSQLGLVQVTFKPGTLKVKPVTEEHHHHHHYPTPWPTPRPAPYPLPFVKPYIWYSNDVSMTTENGKVTSCHYVSRNNQQDSGQPPDDNEPIHVQYFAQSSSPALRSAGGTGLSGHSHQSFITVDELDYDSQYETTINIRFVGIPGQRVDVTPLKPTRGSTPVPPPVWS